MDHQRIAEQQQINFSGSPAHSGSSTDHNCSGSSADNGSLTDQSGVLPIYAVMKIRSRGRNENVEVGPIKNQTVDEYLIDRVDYASYFIIRKFLSLIL